MAFYKMDLEAKIPSKAQRGYPSITRRGLEGVCGQEAKGTFHPNES